MLRFSDVRRTLRETFGFESFRPGQLEVIELLAKGESAFALFPTGSGKSLCFQLPALLFEGATVVVSPLIALMKDQVDAARARGLPAARVDSTIDAKRAERTLEDVAEGRVKILYVAPERCVSERFADAMRSVTIDLLAVDEAHTISQWGTNFRPELLKLPAAAARLGAKRVLALTATATPAVVGDICRSFAIPEVNRVVTSFHRPNLRIEFEPVTARTRLDALMRFPFEGPSIVYATYQATTEDVARRLRGCGHDARPYHAGLGSAERERVQTWFNACARGIVVSTIAFGMGIDKPDIRAVVHYNLPRSVEGYSQEIGRAGRDGASSVCHMLASRDDVAGLVALCCRPTPARASIDQLVRSLFSRGERFRLDADALARAADLDVAVLRTALWHLREAGYLEEQGNGSAEEYLVHLRASPAEILDRYAGARRRVVAAVLAARWPHGAGEFVDAAAVAREAGEPTARVVRALEHLREAGLLDAEGLDRHVEVKILRRPASVEALTNGLERKLLETEARDVERVEEVLALVTHAGCQTRRMLAHFGENLRSACGHCSFCLRGEAVRLAPKTRATKLPYRSYVEGLRAAYADVLADERATARFLFGFASSAFDAADLSTHPAFGALKREDFRQVTAWLQKPFDGVPDRPAMLALWATGLQSAARPRRGA